MTTISIPLFPLGAVLSPDGVLPLQIFEVRYLDMVHKCIADNSPFGVVLLTAGAETRAPGATSIRHSGPNSTSQRDPNLIIPIRSPA